ncbi:MAG TPA: nucleotidyltransferase domain-containing protein [Anaerolineales bacterium]|nr:nucleotidyltransferase domain-containing protein [Anaerolineales bacterium]
MKSIEHIQDFINDFVDWASSQSDVQGVALVGSYARGAAREDSDIDLVILTDQFPKYVEDRQWIEIFGAVEKHQTEDYGKLTSVRVWYQSGLEVEYGLTPPDWAAIPLDEGTREVIRGGMLVLFERGNLLSRHAKL